MHYVIGDVHGCFDEMIAMLNKIEKMDSAAQFIFVGDFVDRGPKVAETLRWAMENITSDGKYQSVLGNHEDMLLSWYPMYQISQREGWYIPPTNYDFRETAERAGLLNPTDLKKIMTFFESLPLRIDRFINGVQFVIVHAWMPAAHAFDPRDTYLWARQANHLGKEIIVHGHTPTIVDIYQSPEYRPGRIAFHRNAINVDGGCCFRGGFRAKKASLCALCLETLEEFYMPMGKTNDLEKSVPTDRYKEMILARMNR